MTRTAQQIGRTALGPRPLPPLTEQRSAAAPSYTDTVLDNGLRVIAVQRPGVPTVEVRVRIPLAGTDRTHTARAEVLATTLLAGTERRSRAEVDEDLARVGGELHASVDPERLLLSGSSLSTELDVLLDVLADALTGATYPIAEVRREKERLVERIAMARSQPRTIARLAMLHRCWGDHPVTRELPDESEVIEVTPDEVRSLHQRALVPRGSVIVLVGDLTPARAIAAVNEALDGWRSDRAAVELPELPDVPGSDLLLVDRPGAVQSQLRLCGPAVARTHPSYPALQLANLAYGGYFSARLPENIREDKGYTYGAASWIEFNPHGGTILIDTDAATEVTAAALLEIRYEMGRLCLIPPDGDEIDSARRYAIGALSISMSSHSGLATTLYLLASYGLDLDWLRSHPARLAAVTRDEVAAAAATFFAPTVFTGVVVGDADVLSAPLLALGGVETPAAGT